MVRFTHDGKAVIYALGDQDAENLWLQPLDGSPGKQITNFKSEQIKDFHWSFDGSKLGMVRGHTDSDVVLLESPNRKTCQVFLASGKADPDIPILKRSQGRVGSWLRSRRSPLGVPPVSDMEGLFSATGSYCSFGSQ